MMAPTAGVSKHVGRKLCIDSVYFLVPENTVRQVEFDIMHRTYSVKLLRQYLHFTVTVIATVRIDNTMA